MSVHEHVNAGPGPVIGRSIGADDTVCTLALLTDETCGLWQPQVSSGTGGKSFSLEVKVLWRRRWNNS